MSILQPGQNIGPYRVMEQVGQGGMASVYKAYHASMDRYVAIKVLPFQFFQNEEFRARFRREVKVIASLEHPYILPVYDSGEDNDMPYLAMRYLETGSLKRRLQHGRLNLDEIDPIFTQLSTALGYAHERDVIHLDIKPANVLIDRRGDIFLTDFGIAKLVGDTAEFTASGAITGTPAYMSPEQAQGYPLDPRSNIYSLGIILYELVTGRVPFEAETPLAVILKHLQEPLPLPSEIDPATPLAVERVILKALAKDREDRYENTQLFLTGWKQALGQASEPSTSQPYLPPTVIERSPLENEATEAMTAATVLATENISQAPFPAPAPALESNRPASTRPPARTLPRWTAPVGIGVALLLCLVLITGGVLLLIQNPPALPISATQDNESASVPTEPSQDSAVPIEPTQSPAGEPDAESTEVDDEPIEPQVDFAPMDGWTSWVSNSHITSLIVFNAQLLAGGTDGISVYSLNSELVDRITLSDGLPDVYVNDLYVHEDRSLWIATDGGIVHQKNGDNTLYSYDSGLASTLVNTIGRVGDTMFAGTLFGDDNSGPHLLVGDEWQPMPNFVSSYDYVERPAFSVNMTAVLERPEGGFWIGTENYLAFFNGDEFEPITTEFGLPDNHILSLFYDQDGVLWVGTLFGAATFAGASFEVVPELGDTTIWDMHQEPNGTMWFAAGGGIWSYQPDQDRWEFLLPDEGPEAPWEYRSVTQADDGELYFGSSGNGVYRFDGTITNLQPQNYPTGTRFGRIIEHPEGLLVFNQDSWIPTDIYSRFSDEWLPASALFEDLSCCVQPLAFTQDGRYWGGGDIGLWIYDFQDAVNLTTRHGLPDDWVLDIAFDPTDHGLAYVATYGGLAIVADEQVVETIFHSETGAPEEGPERVFFQADGTFWVLYHDGAARLSDETWTYFGKEDTFGHDLYKVVDIAEDQNGDVWIATDGEGVYHFDGQAWTQITPDDPGVKLPSWAVCSVELHPDGSIWFGTKDGGAILKDGVWDTFGVDDGLVHSYINDIYITADGEVWIATCSGLSRWTQ